jgi:hypothetical protein
LRPRGRGSKIAGIADIAVIARDRGNLKTITEALGHGDAADNRRKRLVIE